MQYRMPRKFSLCSKKHFKQSQKEVSLRLSIKKIHYLKIKIQQQQLPQQWVSLFTAKNILKFCKITEDDKVSYCFTVHEDLSFYVTYCSNRIEVNGIEDEKIANIETIFDVINEVDKIHICPGNNDDKFIYLAENRKFLNIEGVPIASLQTIPTKTIRHHNCTIVTSSPDKRCITCNNFRKTLFALHHKVKYPKSTNKTFTSHRFLIDTKKNQFLRAFFRKENRFVKKGIADMKLEKFDSYAETNSIAVDESTASDMIKIMNEHNAQISATYSENSFQKLFWDSQLKAVTTPKKSIRWHPSIIKWCIYLRNKSSSAYESL
ncbi:PREDICTED: uncharacterized protein LOC109585115 [Amphimedon queenslandica]|uniref:Uncharacterized protein n=1 Tax=Amphimedon queenslandica TaxID=400682 RepID=A0AAN0JIW9_AMPQE|nr:PREDICTED: uncharacterized protein LOC109585115 [Amphimedon queenslandica]|eukprot:XP_019856623.1 PREDICTED: uncharacterized protein LOC109585115 [Amphimedon queenslandica]